ncbi:MAG: trigger factor [bacterium]|nr:trigger factor [bacterium]
MNLKNVDVKEVDQINREVSIEVPAEKYNELFESKIAEARKDAQIKGFRKGKAPKNIILSNFGEQVKSDVIDELIKQSYSQAVREKELAVASYPTLTSAELADDGVLSYTVKVEVFPKIEKIDTEGLEIHTLDTEATDAEVEEQTQVMLRQHAELRKVERPVAEGDTVVVNLTKILDSKMVLADTEFPASVIDLGNQMAMKEFRDSIPGMKIGDKKEIEINYPEDYTDKKFAGAQIKYSCELKEINERIIPELDDAFAERTGMAKTALELKIKVREDIKTYKEDQIRRQQKNMIIGQMCQKNELPVPKASVEEYLASVIEEQKKENPELDEESVRTQYRPIGENTFRWGMIFHKLAEMENLKVLPEDTENLIKKFADNYKISVEQAKQALQQSGRIANLGESILEEKVLDFLIAKAKVVEVKK